MSPQSPSAGTRGRRLGPWVFGGVVLLLLAVVVIGGVVYVAHRASLAGPTTTTTPAEHQQQLAYDAEQQKLAGAIDDVGASLPTRPGKATPVSGAVSFKTPLPSHQLFGFLPYWELGAPGTTDEVASLTTVAYFALGISGNGALQETGSGWADLQSSEFTQLRDAAHGAGTRVLLTVSTDDNGVLDSISGSPVGSAARFVSELTPLIEQYGFDGVDLDLEGTDGIDRAGFARFADLVADKIHAVDGSWTVAIDTYPQSAGDPDDFYDVAAIAPHVNQVFVMAYDMEDPTVPSANAPLTGAGISDVAALQSYISVVPASKLILGVPFYGVDWTHLRRGTAPGSLSSPVTLTYSTIAGAGHTPLWDPTTDTVWFTYRYGGHEHETWFDNPLSLALKASLAAQYRIAGVGIWALGMQGDRPDLVSALLGGSPVTKLPLAKAEASASGNSGG